MTDERVVLWRATYAMRTLRWLLVRGKALQAELMREYHAAGAKGTNFDDNFNRYTCSTRPTVWATQLVILQTKLANRTYTLEWVGAPLATWLANTPLDELQAGFTAMERAMVETGETHYAEWTQRLRDEMFRRSLPGSTKRS